MTIVRRGRSLTIAVCIASASLLAAQPALAGVVVDPGAKVPYTAPTVKEQQETMMKFLQRILQLLQDLPDRTSETTVTIKRG